MPVTDPVRRDLKAVFQESDEPADNNNIKQRGVLVSQVTIPSERHKNI